MMAESIAAAGDLLAEVQQLRERVTVIEAQLASAPAPAELVPFHAVTYAWVDRLARSIADQWEISPAELVGQRRTALVVRPRQAFYWLLRQAGGYNYPQIGRLVGGRDHTAIIHGLRRAESLRQTDESFRYLTDQLLVIARRLRAERPGLPAPQGPAQ